VTEVLQLSGGKDSLACLYLLKPKWDDLIVAWVNTGAPSRNPGTNGRHS